MSASCEFLVFQTTHRCHSVFSCLVPPASFHDRLVASEKVATRFPPVVDRTSGSFPRFPINVTLFKLLLIHSSLDEMSMPRPHAKVVATWMYHQSTAALVHSISCNTLLHTGANSRLRRSAS